MHCSGGSGRQIPYIGTDAVAIEKVVQGIDGTPYDPPGHGAFLRALGAMLDEIVDRRALGEVCAEYGVYEFPVTAAPLNVGRSTGAPVNPVVLEGTDRR